MLKFLPSALFKLSSGLTGDFIQFNLEDFLAQVEDMKIVDAEPGEGAPKGDWFSTHPFSPLRVKALQLFHSSELMADEGVSVDDLESSVQEVMGLMEPNYIEGKTKVDEAMRRLLFAAAITLANIDGKISDEEVTIFEEFFGKRTLHDGLNLEKLKSTIEDRTKAVNEAASKSKKTQLVRDLVLIAKADETVSKQELTFLKDITLSLGLEQHVLDYMLSSSVELD